MAIRILSLCLVFVMLQLPGTCWAMFLSDTPPACSATAVVQRELESIVLRQRMQDLGLSPSEALSRVETLSNEQIHRFAAHLDSLQAGADSIDGIVLLLLAGVIAVGILELTGHTVMIR